MPVITLPVDMTDVEASTFTLLPADNYKVRIQEVKEGSSDKGDYLNITWEVIENPEFTGRKLWGIAVLPSAKDDPAKMANKAGMFKAFLEAVQMNIGAEFSTEDLVGCVAEATVVQVPKMKDGQDTGDLKNEIKKLVAC